MKKFLLVCLLALVATATWAYDFTDDSTGSTIFYTVVSGGVEVTYGGEEYSKDGTDSYTGEMTIPASVSYGGTTYDVVGIGDHAFYYCAELTTVSLPETVTSIGNYAFDYCSKLTAVSLPETVTSIGSYAFDHCSALTAMSLPDAVTSLGDHVFYYCTSLTSVTLSSSLTAIPAYCFYECQKLGSVTLPATITTIEKDAFNNCWVLEHINLPEGLVSIGDEAFYASGVTSIEFPSTLTTLGDGAFMDANLTSVYVPKTITSIGEGVFEECWYLTDVTLEEGLTYLSWGMFMGCQSLEKITIPSSITDMGWNTFTSCYSLSDVTLTEGMTAAIGNYSFSYCQNLEAINIPGSVKEIGMYAFSQCTCLYDVTLNTGLETIGESAFEQCEAIQQITIPSTVTSIGYGAFGCYDLQKITTLNPEPPTITYLTFDGEQVTVYVPAGTLKEYESEWAIQNDAFENLSFTELDYAVLKIRLSDDDTTGYATYYNGDYDIDLTDTGITAYWAETVQDDVVMLTELDETYIPAKTAVVLKGELTNLTTAAATASSTRSSYTENLLHGQSVTGMLEEEEDGEYQYYMLTTNTTGENVGFYWGNSTGSAFSSKGNKAWLAVPAGQRNALSIKFKDGDEETTSITEVDITDSAVSDGFIYDLAGRRVSTPAKGGVYIVNGKKILF